MTTQFRPVVFNQAFAFVIEIAPKAERMDRHPHWSIAYNRVLTAHSTAACGGWRRCGIERARSGKTLAA